MPVPYQLLIPSNLLIALASLVAFGLLVSWVLPAMFKGNDLLHKKENVDWVNLVACVLLGLCVFLVNTKINSRTSESNPPHGATYGMWDEDPSMELFGGIALFYGGENLAIGSDQWPAQQKAISGERFLRYLLPPFFRSHCYSGSITGCMWADIDIKNYDIRLQWLDYLLQLGIGTICGLIASELVQTKYKRLASRLSGEAG
jgi:hypothetical protein